MGLPSLCSGVSDSYRKRQPMQCSRENRTESAEKGEGKARKWKGKGAGDLKGVRPEDQRNMTFVLQGQRSKER